MASPRVRRAYSRTQVSTLPSVSGPANCAWGSFSSDGADPGFVFVEVLGDAIGLVAEEGIFCEAVGFVADDEGDEAGTHDGGDGGGFVGGAVGAATGEVESVEETPVDGIEKATEILEGAAG